MKIIIRKKAKLRTLCIVWIAVIGFLILALVSDASITQPFIPNSTFKWSSYHAYRLLSDGDVFMQAKDIHELIIISNNNRKWAERVVKKLKLSKLSKRKRVHKILSWIARTYSYDVTQKYVEQARVTHRANCSAYADIMYVLCKAAKIPVRYIIGFDSGTCHAWNRVKVGKKWYWSDPTRYDGCYNGYAMSRTLWSGYGRIIEEW